MISLEKTRELLNEASSVQLQDKEVAAFRDSCAALARIFVDTVLEELGSQPKAN